VNSYVAVTGLPEANPKHAIAMVRFAREVHVKMKAVTRRLERKLGPDTANLAMRVGLHSGPVTVRCRLWSGSWNFVTVMLTLYTSPWQAGVLRGEKARFQLFGDVSQKPRCDASVQYLQNILTLSHIADCEYGGQDGIKWGERKDSRVATNS
jgi:Adenylate and Guanylate cyclase catalytic domain